MEQGTAAHGLLRTSEKKADIALLAQRGYPMCVESPVCLREARVSQ